MDSNDQNKGQSQNQSDDNQPYVSADDRPEVNDANNGDSGDADKNPKPDKASKDMPTGINAESRQLSNQESLNALVAGLYGKLAEVGEAVEGLLNPARPNLQRN